MEKKNILVTGGAGYIGSHACKALYETGYVPVCFDNLSIGHKEAVKWGPLVIGDLRNKKQLEYVFSSYNPVAVMHFAADALVAESMVNPGKYYENNVYSTVNLLETMNKFNVFSLIFSSSCATYGIPPSTPILETHPQTPINPYGKSKLMIESILEDYESAYDFKYAALRYFNAAGADLEGTIGEKHLNETHLIPLILKTALGKRSEIFIYGNDYPTKDGTAVRDYIHVTDLIDAHLKALDYILKNKKIIKVNLGVGKGYSVLEIINAAKKITGKDFTVKIKERRPGDPPILYANNELAEKLLNWIPKYSDLTTILTSAWNWEQKLS